MEISASNSSSQNTEDAISHDQDEINANDTKKLQIEKPAEDKPKPPKQLGKTIPQVNCI